MPNLGNTPQSSPAIHRVQPPWIIRFFSSERRSVMTLIVGLAGIGLILGYLQMKNTIQVVFRLPELPAILEAEESEDDALVVLQQKDTDQDTLTDFDELYVYQTSPYLPDSDSDALADSAEVKAGSDPNCPIGKVCGSALLSEENEAPSPVNEVFGEAADSDAFATIISGGEINAKQLRGVLKDSGAPAQVVDGLSDEAIVSIFSSSTTSEEPDLNALRNLGASDIRVLLKAGGGDDKAIEKMDDATLVEVYQQAIDQQSQLNPSKPAASTAPTTTP